MSQENINNFETVTSFPQDETLEAIGQTAFTPLVEEIGSVEKETLGDRGWERDGGRYQRGD